MKWLHATNSYLALLTWSCKADFHVGLKKSTWHDFNHDQDSGCKGISRNDVALSNPIGLVSDLLWHLFLNSLSEICGRCQAYESICQKSAVRWQKTKTAIARTRIPHRENKLPTSYLHCFNFSKEANRCQQWCPLSHQPAIMRGCSGELREFHFLLFLLSPIQLLSAWALSFLIMWTTI